MKTQEAVASLPSKDMSTNVGKREIANLFVVVFLLLGFIYLGQISNTHERLYSPHTALRLQVDAFLKGQLHIFDSIQELREDLAWHDGKVQQVWGLGVPMLRLPFEAVFRQLGYPFFPDRVIFLYYFLVVSGFFYFTILTTLKKLELSFSQVQAVAFSILVAWFPPFIAITRSRFSVYEEVIAYGYLYGILVFSLLLMLWAKPTLRTWFLFCFFSSFAAFIRPTLLAYSFAGIPVAYLLIRNKLSSHHVILGGTLFCSILLLFFYQNYIRFGYFLETGPGVIVASDPFMLNIIKFDSAFTLLDNWATKVNELYSALFTIEFPIKFKNSSTSNMFANQAAQLRWRFLYFPTYNLIYLAVLIFSPAIIVFIRNKIRKELLVITAFSYISFAILFAFYVNLSFISSRYFIDFAAAIASICVIFILSLNLWIKQLGSRFAWLSVLPILCLIMAINWKHYSQDKSYITKKKKAPSVTSYQAKVSGIKKYKSPVIPEFYKVETNIKDYNLPYNGIGWNSNTGQLKTLASFIIFNPKKIKIELYRIDKAALLALASLKVKIGLEELDLENISVKGREATLIFSAPKLPVYQRGPQLLFIRFTEIGEKVISPLYRLKKLSWNEI